MRDSNIRKTFVLPKVIDGIITDCAEEERRTWSAMVRVLIEEALSERGLWINRVGKDEKGDEGVRKYPVPYNYRNFVQEGVDKAKRGESYY